MNRTSRAAAIAAIGMMVVPAISLAQTGGGGAGGSTSGAASGQTGGTGNSAGLATPPAAGTNSAGTAQSSGGRPNAGPGVTTGSAPPRTKEDEAIDKEDMTVDRKVNGICRGC